MLNGRHHRIQPPTYHWPNYRCKGRSSLIVTGPHFLAHMLTRAWGTSGPPPPLPVPSQEPSLWRATWKIQQKENENEHDAIPPRV